MQAIAGWRRIKRHQLPGCTSKVAGAPVLARAVDSHSVVGSVRLVSDTAQALPVF